MDKCQETWKEHPHLPIEVSNIQRVRTLKGRVLTRTVNDSGYTRISVKRRFFSLTRLIVETYLNPDIKGKIILMKDKKVDNPFELSNLIISDNRKGLKSNKKRHYVS